MTPAKAAPVQAAAPPMAATSSGEAVVEYDAILAGPIPKMVACGQTLGGQAILFLAFHFLYV